jgi:drug/metabolite transporter (DMT)-like permease
MENAHDGATPQGAIMSNRTSALAAPAQNTSVAASGANARSGGKFYLLPLLAVCIWSGNTIVTKAASTAIEPAAIAFYRWVLAVLVMTPFLARAAWRQRAAIAADWNWARLLLLGALGMAMYQGLAYEAAHSTSAVNMGVTVALMPLISACLSSLLSGERLSTARIAGGLVSLLGLIVLSTHGAPGKLFSGGLHTGDALMLIAVASNALYGVLLKRWSLPLTTWTQLYVQAIFGSLILLPFWLAAPASPLTAQNLPMVLYAGLLASIGAPFLWMNAIKHLGAPRSALFANLLPLLVALAAWALLGEQLHAYHALAGALVLAGVIWGQRSAH